MYHIIVQFIECIVSSFSLLTIKILTLLDLCLLCSCLTQVQFGSKWEISFSEEKEEQAFFKGNIRFSKFEIKRELVLIVGTRPFKKIQSSSNNLSFGNWIESSWVEPSKNQIWIKLTVLVDRNFQIEDFMRFSIWKCWGKISSRMFFRYDKSRNPI